MFEFGIHGFGIHRVYGWIDGWVGGVDCALLGRLVCGPDVWVGGGGETERHGLSVG